MEELLKILDSVNVGKKEMMRALKLVKNACLNMPDMVY